jgi:hypothetical protein
LRRASSRRRPSRTATSSSTTAGSSWYADPDSEDNPAGTIADGSPEQYKQESDVMIYTVLPADENEILGYNTILCIRDSLHLLFK